MNIIVAARNGNIDRVKELIRYKDKVDRCGNTALIYAACNGRLEIVKVLLSHGADVNIANKYGHTALMYAVNDKHFKIVKVLTEYIKNEKIKIEYEEWLMNEKYSFIKKICGVSFNIAQLIHQV